MDPITITTSILAIAGALYTVSQKLRRCASTLAHAAREIVALAKELNACSTLFRSLQCTIRLLCPLLPQGSDVLMTCRDLVSQAQDNVKDFNRFLKDLRPLSHSKNASILAKAIARLKWAFQRTDLLLLKSKLDSSKTTINMCLVMIHLRCTAQQLAAARDESERDREEIRRLRRQMKLLRAQLRDERSTVRDAIATSRRLEYHIQGPGQSSINLRVARQALSLAKTQLEQYDTHINREVHRRHISNPCSFNSSDITSNISSPRPGPMRPPSPPPSPPLPGTVPSPPHPLLSTRDPGRRRSRIATDISPSGAWRFEESSLSSNPRVDTPGTGVHPLAMDINTDMGYRSARALGQRQARGSRVRVEDRNIVWTETHHGDEDL